MTAQEAQIIQELTEAVSVAMNGLLAISKTATETATKIRESMSKAKELVANDYP